MSNPSKAIGTRAETRVARFLTANGIRCDRRALAGSKDEGDLRATLDSGLEVTIEVKAGKQTSNPRRSQLEEWQRQTLQESENSGCPALLVIVRYNRPFTSSEVWLKNSQWWGGNGWTMMYIDEFVATMW